MSLVEPVSETSCLALRHPSPCAMAAVTAFSQQHQPPSQCEAKRGRAVPVGCGSAVGALGRREGGQASRREPFTMVACRREEGGGGSGGGAVANAGLWRTEGRAGSELCDGAGAKTRCSSCTLLDGGPGRAHGKRDVPSGQVSGLLISRLRRMDGWWMDATCA